MDILSIIFGIVFTLTILYIIKECYLAYNSPEPMTIDDPTDDEDFQELQDTPHCPYCQSYNLKLIDDNAQVSFLKSHIPELDHYQCKNCYETFSDEDWKNVKVYNDTPSTDD